jgi:hypothetical protein
MINATSDLEQVARQTIRHISKTDDAFKELWYQTGKIQNAVTLLDHAFYDFHEQRIGVDELLWLIEQVCSSTKTAIAESDEVLINTVGADRLGNRR